MEPEQIAPEEIYVHSSPSSPKSSPVNPRPTEDPCSMPVEVAHTLPEPPLAQPPDTAPPEPNKSHHTQPLHEAPVASPPTQQTGSHFRLFLDLFAGVLPSVKAMQQIGGDYLAPFDFALHSTHDILDDRVMHLLQKLCFSGVVGVAWSAPPCKEFSRLKLKQPGPKALRTPQHMDGVPGLSPSEQARVDASTEIHCRSRTLLRAVFSAAGQAGMEQPPSAMSWLQADNIALLREWCAHIAYVSVCSHGLDFYKALAFCASFESIASLIKA